VRRRDVEAGDRHELTAAAGRHGRHPEHPGVGTVPLLGDDVEVARRVGGDERLGVDRAVRVREVHRLGPQRAARPVGTGRRFGHAVDDDLGAGLEVVAGVGDEQVAVRRRDVLPVDRRRALDDVGAEPPAGLVDGIEHGLPARVVVHPQHAVVGRARRHAGDLGDALALHPPDGVPRAEPVARAGGKRRGAEEGREEGGERQGAADHVSP
jgi:hypothetical protein